MHRGQSERRRARRHPNSTIGNNRGTYKFKDPSGKIINKAGYNPREAEVKKFSRFNETAEIAETLDDSVLEEAFRTRKLITTVVDTKVDENGFATEVPREVVRTLSTNDLRALIMVMNRRFWARRREEELKKQLHDEAKAEEAASNDLNTTIEEEGK